MPDLTGGNYRSAPGVGTVSSNKAPDLSPTTSTVVKMFKHQAYTRSSPDINKSYNARKARELLGRYPQAEAVIVSDDAPTKRGLTKIKSGNRGIGESVSKVLYYRKSSGGKWGRSAELTWVKPAK